jgi:seryl-tRNA synthetase
MLDIKWIVNNPDAFDKAMKKREVEIKSENLIKLYKIRNGLITIIQSLQSQRNIIAKKIGELKTLKKDATKEMKKSKEINKKLEEVQAKFDDKKSDELYQILSTLPNILQDDVKIGKDDSENVEIKKYGKPTEFDFKPKAHYELGEALGLMDFEQTVKLCGERSATLIGPLSLLERALSNFFLDFTGKYGYKEISMPFMVKDRAMFGTGNLPKFAEDAYQTTNSLWLIPTSEVTMTNWVTDKILNEEELPIRLTAYTPCFRSEAGSAGKDTRGMLRQHQFKKVEMVSITTPEKSKEEHERMVNIEGEILEALKLPYRRVIQCTGDTGFSSTKTYDHEVWLPGQGKYREITSCSNCGDFQARRMNAKFRKKENKITEFVHTLNGSALAVGRTIIAIMENYQQKDGTIKVPEVLVKYMNGVEVIK